MKKIYKLQAIGGSIYVALPRDWVRRHGLDKGSLVEVEVCSDGSLKIKPLSSSKNLVSDMLRIDLEIDDPNEAMNSIVMSYLQGYDVIVLKLRNNIVGKDIRKIILESQKVLLGLEIVDEDEHSITLQILPTGETDVSTLLRSMSSIARSMFLDVAVALLYKDIELAKTVPIRDLELNKLYFYTTRMIRKRMVSKSIPDPHEILRLLDLRLFAKVIEEIGDEAKKAAQSAIKILEHIDETRHLDLNVFMGSVHKLDLLYQEVIHSLLKTRARTKLCELMRRCEDVKNLFINLKDSVTHISDSVALWLFELFESYEKIAALVYDMISLAPYAR